MEKMKYNQHGEGTLSKRLDGRWEARLTINGKRKSFYGKTEREAKKKMREYQEKLMRGEKDCKKIKISVYFEEWLEHTQKGKLKASSYDRIERTYRTHIQNTVGGYQLGNLTTKDCQKLINHKAETLSYSTTKKIYEALNSCLKYAEAIGDINRNPMKAVELPSEHNFKKKTKDIEIPTESEMKNILVTAFLKHSTGTCIYTLPYAYAIVIIANTGLRVGELLAMEWSKINFLKSSMKVDCSVSEVIDRDGNTDRKRILLVSNTKTKNGNRTILLNKKVVNALEELKSFYLENNISSKYVICNSQGEIVNYRDLKRTFDKILKRAKVNSMGLHSLRHYFASVCIAHKIGTFELSRMLGHGKVSVTLDTYGHLMENQEDEIRNLLEVI